MERESGTHWGRIAFGVGIVTCVIAGAVVGVILGNGNDDADRGVLRRVTALALDTRGLNDDAIALSRAIEEAIEREELEGEAETLRVRLALLEKRAERIQARARSSRAASGPGSDRVSDSAERRWARRGLSEVRSAVAIFNREVAAGLDEALASSSTSAATSALANATAVAEQQSAKMTELSESGGSEQPEGERDASGPANDQADAAPVSSGRFSMLSTAGGEPLDAEYELAAIEAEAEESPEIAGEWEVTATVSGILSIAHPVHESEAAAVSPMVMMLFWEESELPAGAGGDARFQLGEEETDLEEGTETASASCAYELRGHLYCALVAFALSEDEGDAAAPPSEEEADLGRATPAGVLRLETDRDAVAVSELIGNERPALVQVVEAAPEGLFRPACEPPARPAEPAGTVQAEDAETTEVEAGEAEGEIGETVALLDGDGLPIFEAEEPSRVPAPACYEVVE